jgi:small-conductance mechanosensitive channel
MTDKLSRFLDWLALNMDALALGLLVAVGLIALMLIARSFGHRSVARDPACLTWTGVIGRVLSRTSVLFMAVAALEIVVTYAEPPARIAHLFDNAFIIAFALQAAVWGRELILGVIGARVGERPGETTLGNAMGVIRVLVSVAVFAIAIIVILDNLGVNVTALVAGLGIGGIAIGLAAQGIFSDLFAALAILFDKPFRRGDTIRFDTTVGTVEKIGLKTTRLTSLTGEQVIMANTKLLEREIHARRSIDTIRARSGRSSAPPTGSRSPRTASTSSPTRPRITSSSTSTRRSPRRPRSAAPSPTASSRCRSFPAWPPTSCWCPRPPGWASTTASTGSASCRPSAPASASAAASPWSASRRSARPVSVRP